jgi:hypothetical protein
MAKNYGKAGQGARAMGQKRRLLVLLMAIAMFAFGLLLLTNHATVSKLGLPLLIAMVFGIKALEPILDKKAAHLIKRAKDAERGAKGEEYVADKLAMLPEGYFSFHDLAFEGFNVDHVVVGPTGIFVVETKSHRGKVTSNGEKLLLNGRQPDKNFISQAWSQTFHMRNILKDRTGKEWSVMPVLCFSNAFVQVRGLVKGVAVINNGYLNTYITKQKVVLSSDELAQATACMKMTTRAADAEKRVCPQCNQELVLRQFQSGPKIGQFFYGCLACRKGWPVVEN